MTQKDKVKSNRPINNEKGVDKICFVIMPYTVRSNYHKPDHFDSVYEYLITPACKRAGFTPKLSKDFANSEIALIDITENLMNCDMVLCDLSDNRANVFLNLD